ncbi:MAG: hypothetical protein UV30_C0016G0012, partial [Candidatus Collierbacteria bacterium GW2011_GWF1_42_50]
CNLLNDCDTTCFKRWWLVLLLCDNYRLCCVRIDKVGEALESICLDRYSFVL